MAGETEEKNLPPSQRKLKKAREKGQVASSQDFVSGLIFTFGIIVVLAMWPRYLEVFTGSLRLALDNLNRPFAQSGPQVFSDLFTLIFQALMPLLVVVAAVGFVGHVAHKKGLIFSFDPVKPDFNKLNPVEGFTKIFSFRNAVDFGVVLLRSLIWLVVSGLVIWLALPQIVMSPGCGLPCVTTAGFDLIKTLVIIAIILIIVIGILDLPLQTFMFLRDQKMSRSELKREMKEQEGSPEFAGHRKEQHRLIASGGGATGMRVASLIFVSSGEAVAIRYDANAQPVPIIVAKGKGVNADPILKAAELLDIPVVVDPYLAGELVNVGIGGMVPERLFTPVALALVKHQRV